MKTLSGTFSPPIALHPALTSALTPALSTASKMVLVKATGSSTTMEPKLGTDGSSGGSDLPDHRVIADSPYIDRRWTGGQELCQLWLRLVCATFLQEKVSDNVCSRETRLAHVHDTCIGAHWMLTDMLLPILWLGYHGRTPTVDVRDLQPVRHPWSLAVL